MTLYGQLATQIQIIAIGAGVYSRIPDLGGKVKRFWESWLLYGESVKVSPSI